MSTRLGGRYQLVRELGAGGMGRVFQAVDTETGRAVAAKVMLATSEDNLEALLRFQQEGAVLSTLKHPNIVEVYSTFLEEHTSAIIMELLEGRSLSQLLKTERLALPRIQRLVQQVVSALVYAHGRGIVHRDIKPDNIMVVGNDQVKVTDFGIARILREGATLNTAPGTSIGTPLYMAPEQIEGQKVDGRADIYSLGAVMYQMVTGRPPFEGEDPLTVAFKHVHRAPEPPSTVNADVPSDWEALILKALSKHPSARFQTAAAMEEALAALGSTATSSATAVRPALSSAPAQLPDAATRTGPELTAERPTPPPERDRSPLPGVTNVVPAAAAQQPAPQGRRGVPPWAFAGGAVVVLLLAGVGFLATQRGSTPPKATPTSLPSTAARIRAPAAVWGSLGSQAGHFDHPAGVAIDGQGDIYVADAGNNRIQKLAASSDPLLTWGARGSEPGQLSHPTAVAVDSGGTIYIADTANSRVVKLSAKGKLLDVWGAQGSGDGQFDHPAGIAVDSAGDIYVADTGNDRIQKLSPQGKVLAVWGTQGSQPGQFNQPRGIAVDGQGNVFVADSGNNRIQELASTSDPIAQWGRQGSGKGQLRDPGGIALGPHSDMYVVDTGNDRIEELSSSGRVLATWGAAGSTQGKFLQPQGIAVDSSGNVYVTDTGNNRIQKFAPAS